jgi:phosphoglycerate dehydrogenase-like enzyme
MVFMAEIPVLITVPFPHDHLERLKALSPRLRVELFPVRGSEALPEEKIAEAEVLYTSGALPDPEAAPRLKWVQFHYAGLDQFMDHPILRSDVIITTLSGVAASSVTEFVMMGILAMGRRLLKMMQDNDAKRWADDRLDRFRPVDLRGSTVGIVGYGSIGREVSRVSHAFGAKVLAAKRDLKELENKEYRIDALGDPDASLPRRIYPPQALASMASECDFLVVSVPLTQDTRGLVGEKVIRRMKPTSFLIDVSRGGVVDHGALVEALQEKRIGGAVLDVYPVEPIPAGSPLWDLPNVILSPHIGGSSSNYLSLAMDLFVENMQRYLADQPLLNRFRRERGY